MNRVLFLTGKSGISSEAKFSLQVYLKAAKVSMAQVSFANLHSKLKAEAIVYKAKKASLNPAVKAQMLAELDKWIELTKPKVIVTNDNATCGLLSGKASTFVCRGSVYEYKGIPVIITQNFADIHGSREGGWALLNDWQKVGRWVRDEQRAQPKFDYFVCRTRDDLQRVRELAVRSIATAYDIENYGTYITVMGYGFLLPDGSLVCPVIPFHDGGGPYWATQEDEEYAWQTVKFVNETPAPKIAQNGNYDNSYLLLYRVPPRNYFYDTAIMFWAIWCEAQKKLNFQSSILLDYYRYWKDDIKGEKDEKINPGVMERYWRYNALDNYYTLCNWMRLTWILAQPSMDWAKKNFIHTMELQVGPAFDMSMYGFRIDFKELDRIRQDLSTKYEKELATLRVMADDPEFNPNSPDQVASLIYDVFGAKVPKLRGKNAALKERSADEKVLKLVADQHPLFDAVIQQIWKTKKPRNNKSKYCDVTYRHDSFFTTLAAGATETSRWASKKPPTHIGVGNNAQNIPGKMRGFLIADPGRVLFDNDFAQSDAVFVAYESGDQKFIHTVTCGKDSHCIHAAHFFKLPYETVYDGYKAGDPFFADDVTGVRAITKKIVHGSNYKMAAFTMFMTMGRKAVVGAAKALGFADAENWTEQQLVNLCEKLIASYNNELYPGVPAWQNRILRDLIANGHRATNGLGFSRLFLGNPQKDKGIERELASFYGQGDTGGNINRTIHAAFYKYRLWEHGLRFHAQVHDSLVFSTPHDKMWLNQNILDIMQEKLYIHDREMFVKADSKVGIRWKDGMISWKPDTTYAEVMEKTGKGVCFLSQQKYLAASVQGLA